jgi:hypothetical protein
MPLRTFPARVRVHEAALIDLRDFLFTRAEFAKITAKISIICDGSSIIAEDDLGGVYDYGEEGFPQHRPDIRAEQWFGVSPGRF